MAGRPQRWQDAKQLSFRLERPASEELLATKPETESNSDFFAKFAELYKITIERAKAGCKIAMATLRAAGLAFAIEASAQPKGENDVRRPTTAHVLPILPERDHQVSPVRPHREVPQDPEPRENVSGAPSPLVLATKQEDHAGAAQRAQLTPPPKPRFPDRAYENGRSSEISSLRKTIWEEFPEELADCDDRALNLNGLPVEGRAWLEMYEANLIRLRRARDEEAAPAPKKEEPPPLTTEQLVEKEVARYKAEVARINQVRVIASAPELLRLAKEEHLRIIAQLRREPPKPIRNDAPWKRGSS
jgi:hypothetical protein